MSTLDTQHAETHNPPPPPTTTNEPGGSDRFRRQRRRRRRRRPSMAGCSSETTTDGSFRFSDTSEDEYHSWRSSMGSITGFGGDGGGGVGRSGSLDECTLHGVVWGFNCGPCMAEEEVDLESGELEMRKGNKEEEVEKDCRICHLSLMGNGISDDDLNGNGGIGIELGCSCKGDLGNAHKQCAETWFKIKGNTTCEICGAIAINIAGEQAPDLSSDTVATPPAAVAISETRNYCHGRRVMNFLLACMIFAFVISWLFHFNVLN